MDMPYILRLAKRGDYTEEALGAKAILYQSVFDVAHPCYQNAIRPTCPLHQNGIGFGLRAAARKDVPITECPPGGEFGRHRMDRSKL